MRKNTISIKDIKFIASFRQESPPKTTQQKDPLTVEESTTRQLQEKTHDSSSSMSSKQKKKLLAHKARNITVKSNEKFLRGLEQFEIDHNLLFKKVQCTELKDQQQEVPIRAKMEKKKCFTSIPIDVIQQYQVQQEIENGQRRPKKGSLKTQYTSLPIVSWKENSTPKKKKGARQFLGLPFYLSQKQQTLIKAHRKFSRTFSLLDDKNQQELKKQKQEIKRLQQNFGRIYLEKSFLNQKLNNNAMNLKGLKKGNAKKNNYRKGQLSTSTKFSPSEQNSEKIKAPIRKKQPTEEKGEAFLGVYNNLLSHFLQKQCRKTSQFGHFQQKQ